MATSNILIRDHGPGRTDGPPGDGSTAPTVAPTSVRAADHTAEPVQGGAGSLSRGRMFAGIGVLLAATAVLYLWGLGASGYANSFYSAAAQAGASDWKAFFFGSLDGANSITVDKPPAAIWVMALSVRLFGLSSWSILVPEALMGVASVGVLYAAVRRTLTGGGTVTTIAHRAALAGAAVFALTPAATLMFRFNNPDALLVLLTTLASYFTVRAVEHARARWLVGAGVLIGFAFLTKMLQAFLVLPALVVAYAVAAPTTWGRKIRHLLYAFGAMIAAAGWYVAIFELVPTSWRPYMGGSQDNSFLQLVFGYNGLGRITGNEVGSVTGGGAPGSGGMWGQTGLSRLFDGVSGGMIAWLAPAAVILLVGAFVATFRRVPGLASHAQPTVATIPVGPAASPASRLRAGLLVWGGSLVVTWLVFSFMAGIYHDYYTVALAPGIGGSVALGFTLLWLNKDALWARLTLAAATAATALWAWSLLGRAGGGYAQLGVAVAALGLLVALGFVLVTRLPAIARTSLAAAAVVVALAGPTAYSVNTAATPHQGSIVTAGPVSSGGPGGRGGPAGGPGGGGMGGPGGQPPAMGQNQPGQNQIGQPGQNQIGQPPQPPAGMPQPGQNTGTDGGPGPGPGGMGGGMLGGATVSTAMKAALLTDADSYTWVAAAIGSQTAASYQLATEHPVMAIGGFNGSDPAPTLAQFQQLVAAKKIHYFIAGGMGGQQNGGSSAASEIATWVSQHYSARTIGGATVYDLTQAAQS